MRKYIFKIVEEQSAEKVAHLLAQPCCASRRYLGQLHWIHYEKIIAINFFLAQAAKDTLK